LQHDLGAFRKRAGLVENEASVLDVSSVRLGHRCILAWPPSKADDPEVNCVTDVFDDNANELELGVYDPDWFVDVGNFDSHLTGVAPPSLLTTAQWQAGDPTVDIDGDPRPDMNGADDVAGADVP